VTSVANELNTLPQPAVQTSLGTVPHFVSKTMVLPPQRLVRATTNTMFLAKASAPSQGLVLDYVTMISQGGYTFQGDTTYYISGTVNMYSGLAIFEGGAVFKYATVGTLFLNTSYIWQASAYRPIIFTSKHDNSVGETISGSSGNPGCFFGPALEFEGYPGTLAHFRIAYAKVGLYLLDDMTDPGMIVTDAQFVNCATAIEDQMWGNGWSEVMVENSLFANVQVSLNLLECSVAVENSTFANCQCLVNANSAYPYNTSALSLTNCILANVTNLYSIAPWPFNGDFNGFYNSPPFGVATNGSSVYPFQSVGAGNYYLTNGCGFHNVGTNNIDSTLLAALQQKTTYPPIVYIPATISTNLTFSPQAQRDTNSNPDLGYHYDPIDYALGGVYVTNATVIVNPGTVIATYATNNITYGLGIGSGAQLFCQGLANSLNRIVQYNTVQEQAITNWSRVSSGSIESEFLNVSPAATIFCRFTDWSMPAQDAPHLNGTNGICNPINLQDCQFHGGTLVSSYPTINLTNCLFERVNASLWSADTNIPSLRNNLFWCGTFNFAPNVTNALVKDNLFDQTSISNNSGTCVTYNGGFNAFVTNYNRLQPTFTNDVILSNSPVYQTNWLGNYYLPTNSPLINHGSTNANLVGLYHYTTQTNQVKETNSIVDIGYHYVAVDTNGIPIDTDGDGIPDYLEDVNGNGLVDAGETNWGLAILTQPVSQVVPQGTNVTFAVTAGGIAPLSYQWCLNGTNVLGGATNASLTLEDVQTTDAGGYSVVITNAAGSATSSNATLTVMSWTVDSDYDGVSDAQEIVDGTDPFNPDSGLPIRLGYWRFDDTNTWVGDAGQLPLLATNVVGVPSWNINAALIDSTNPAILTYRDVEINGNANINLRQGTIRFWFKPDWSSADWIGHYGTGPGSNGRLIEMGNYDPAFTNGWWALYLSPDGTQLTFGSSTNGAGNTNLSATVSWALKRWHQIVLTYSPTNSTLYWDGQEIATDGTGTNYYPSLTERTNGFRIGSDAYGGNQAGGVFDELETFNYQLTATDIANDYDYATVTLPLPPTVTITSPTGDSTNFVGTSQSLTITVDAQAASGHSVQEVDYSYNGHMQGDPPIGISTQNPTFPITWINTDWINAFVGAYDITAIAIDDRGVASDPATASDVTIMLDSDGDGIPDWWMLQYFGHPTGESGDNSLAGDDANSDGVSNLQEYQYGTDPIVMPVLEILSGNNQGGNYDSFLPLPVTIQVVGTNSVVLTNAPVTFTVTDGTALLATTANGATNSALSLRTDSNGQASVWVYFPPSGSNPPDSTILMSASSGINFATVIANEYVLLGHWRFDDTNTWVGEAGQLPLLTDNLAGVPSWSSNAVVVDSTSPALLAYRVVEANGNTNINCETGSVLFYFKPDWSSADQGGTGPGSDARLIEMGNYNPAFTNGWWALFLNSDGTQLSFGTSTNGSGAVNLSMNISWVANEWHQIALAYSPTGSALFVDGQLLATGDGVTNFPNADELANGFRIGSDQDGNNQAGGTFDELETFASPLSGIGDPVDAYWFGIPDYKADPNGTLGAWQILYFGHLGLDPNSDPYGAGNTLLYDYEHNLGPNGITFSFSVPNQYVTTNVVDGVITVLGGVPSNIAVLLDSTNFADALWTAYTSSNITLTLSTNQGAHDVWIGLIGSSPNAQPAWEETTVILDSISPTVSITNPVDGASLNASRVDVCGNFIAASLKQITVNGILAFVNGANFEALNVPLDAGTNTITAIIEDLTGDTNTSSITIIGTTNADGSLNAPVQFQATPVAGFAPLQVVFQVQTNVPGTIQQVLYDFNGDDIADFVTNNFDSITYTYATNGEYFPVVTIQTDAGRFSSVGGWNSASFDPSNQPVRINVQTPATQSTLASITDPVDLKWDGTHLYVLSGSMATITEFDPNGNTIASLPLGGGSPSGIDVDAAGNVYVAVTSSNQVWKFNPTGTSFQADTNFGLGGCIGLTNGATGTDTNEFNAPFDVAVTPDGSQISVSDSTNNRIQQFSAANGSFIASFGSQGSDIGQFNTPKGLTYDSSGILYIADSGNNRIVLAQFTAVIGATGTGGADLGQFISPGNISVGKRGVYVADTGNNRIQKFDLPPNAGLFSITPSSIGYAVTTNLNQPAAVAAVDDPMTDIFYVADTANNRIVLYSLTADDATPAWTGMTAHIAAGDIPGAMQYFSSVTANDYNQDFLAIGTANVIPAINQIGTLTPASINGDEAEYYFQQTINGHPITFKVEFVKENGVWKIFEF
jgi:sugar lactone lactonase YvrE